MKLKTKITTFVLGFFLTILSFGQTKKTQEYLGVGDQISFDKKAYHLTWTSHPSETYYKQEYIAKEDAVDKFKKLILLEFLAGKTTLKEVVATKITEIKQMKASNPIINYETFEKNGEVMLDFLVSANTPDGKELSIVERNVYRYKSVVGKNGEKGVLLFGVSERAYDNDIDKFLINLKAHRFDLINLVGAFELPELTIVK